MNDVCISCGHPHIRSEYYLICDCGHCYGSHYGDDCDRCNLKNCFKHRELATEEDFWKELGL